MFTQIAALATRTRPMRASPRAAPAARFLGAQGPAKPGVGVVANTWIVRYQKPQPEPEVVLPVWGDRSEIPHVHLGKLEAMVPW